jgi:hypothetical protein
VPKFLEKKLQSKYGKDSSIPYKIMNSLGAMRGNKETNKGRQMEKKHNLGLGNSDKHNSMKQKKKKSFTEALNN